MKKQFEHVDGSRGAPMGRSQYGEPPAQRKSMRLFMVRLVDGYDDGGAYWGMPHNLYCAIGDGYRRFTRADSRAAAAQALGLTNENLKIAV